MGDLFDIANLISTVGVDGIKIKPEPGLPEKSSNQILTELFSTFDADEDVTTSENTDQQVPNAVVKTEKSEKLPTKKKKSKKKHKHKEKKHKKKAKRNTSESTSDIENNSVKRKRKHKKKSKRKRDNDSKSPDSDEPKTKSKKLEVSTDDTKDKAHDNSLKEASPLLPPITKKQEEIEEPVPKILEKSKQSFQGKILIKDLKNSTVYNETVKEIECKEKAKAARMEDGELSDSSSENRTPTLSPSPSQQSLMARSPALSPTTGQRRCSSSGLSSKNDLRLILKERGKKRLEVTDRSRSHGENDCKDSKSHNDHKHRRKSKDRKRGHSSQSQERKRSESPARSNSHRSRSRGREWHRGRSKNRYNRSRSYERRESGRSRERKRHWSRSTDRNREPKYSRVRSRSKERKERIEIDKKKLLEIARRNAINMIKQGTLPLAQQDKAIAAIQAGGKTVDELTDFCKSLSKSEALGELSSISSEENDSGSEKGFHHPFLIKERPSSIIVNIKDAKQLPTKTFQEKTAESSNQLRLQFPVSSGQQHRKTESEWIPVTSTRSEPKKAAVPPSMHSELPIGMPQGTHIRSLQPPVFAQQSSAEAMDIGAIVSQRLAAMRKLRENPNDASALNEMYRAQTEMKSWAESKQMPGQFTGSTGAKVLTPAELTSGYQAWARKDQLVSAQPVSGGMGMALLQKMGWRPGEGLGKNKEGTLEPLQLEVKLDKRGLVSEQDIGQKPGKAAKPVIPAIKTTEGKHPVSLLGEYCSKRKTGAPVYELCFECGPDHRKNFLFKVRVNGIEYKPTVASPNKKQAKAEAAQICLQSLGLLPEPLPLPLSQPASITRT